MLQKYHKTTLSVVAAVICTILGVPSTCMPSQRINTAQTETHSKIFPSPTYMEITKNRKGLSLFKVRERSQACEPIDGHYRSNGQQLLLWCHEHWSLKPRPSSKKRYADCRPTLAIH